MWQTLHNELINGDAKALARSISLIENEATGYEEFLASLPAVSQPKIIGITGPPGAGKSTLVDALVGEMIKENKKIAVLCVDPSSPFHFGALLGDRIRMSQWYNHPGVFIRSLATRGSLGGLPPKIVEITSLINAAGYDYIFIETVGVGQSEVEIVALADVTIVVLVPEAGDDIQAMKAGLMEIADIFALNKSDRPDANEFERNLQQILSEDHKKKRHIVTTVATQGLGIEELMKKINACLQYNFSDKPSLLVSEKVFYLIQQQRMRDINKKELKEMIQQEMANNKFNLYSFVKRFDNH
jgi:LAO/AO transport system kinase